jgi:hypothetical protein
VLSRIAPLSPRPIHAFIVKANGKNKGGKIKSSKTGGARFGSTKNQENSKFIAYNTTLAMWEEKISALAAKEVADEKETDPFDAFGVRRRFMGRQ